jgi:hypothetical protein
MQLICSFVFPPVNSILPRFRFRFPHSSDSRSDASESFWTRASRLEPPPQTRRVTSTAHQHPLLLDQQSAFLLFYHLNTAAYSLFVENSIELCHRGHFDFSFLSLPLHPRQNAQIKSCKRCGARSETNIKMQHPVSFTITS